MMSDWSEVKEDKDDIHPDWSEVKSEQPQKSSLGKIFSGIKEAGKQLIPGIKEGFQGSLHAIPGIGNKFPEPTKQEPVPENVPGASISRNLGRGIGSLPVIAGAAAPFAMTGGALGIPATIAEIGAAGIGGALTTEGDPFHRGVGAVESMVPVGAFKGAINLPSAIKILKSKFDPKIAYKAIQKGHDVIDKEASGLFQKVKGEGETRNIPSQDNPSMKKYIDEVSEYLPEDKAMKSFIERAKTGDYGEIRDFQSQLGTLGSDFIKSRFPIDRYKGRQILSARRKINSATIKHLEDMGHKDLAEDLSNAVSLTRYLKNTYYKNPSVRKLVDKETRAEPASFKQFERESKSIDALKKIHPEINQLLELKGQKEKLAKVLKLSGISTSSIAPTLASLKYLLGGNKPPVVNNYVSNQNQGEES